MEPVFEVGAASDEELCERRLWLEREQRRRDAEVARVEAELERRGTTDRQFGLSTGAWVAAETGLAVGAARSHVERSRRLVAELDRVLAALEAGELSWAHVEVIVKAANPRIAGKVAAVQQLLIDEARGTRFGRWRNLVRYLADQLDDDGGHDPARDRVGTAFCSPVIDGLVHLFAGLDAAQAPVVTTELERVTDELWRRAVRDHDQDPEQVVPSRAELRAEALVEICRRSGACVLAESRAPRPEVVVVLRPDQGHDGLAPWATTADGVPVKPDVLQGLCADAVWRAMWIDPTGVPLRLGRSKRHASPGQRLALAERDGGCVFPGCDRPVGWCDVHHVTEWDAEDGCTDVPVLALLCRHHHGVTHRAGWSMAAEPDQTFTWTTPAGRTLRSQRHHRRLDRVRDPDGIPDPDRRRPAEPSGAAA